MNKTPGTHPESLLGIEYEIYFAQTYIPILIRGEHEWLNNATSTYASDAGEVWASDILTRLLERRLQPIDLEDLQLYTPKMLNELLGEQTKTLQNHHLLAQLNTIPIR